MMFEFSVDFVPHSLKNGQKLIVTRGRRSVTASDEARAELEHLKFVVEQKLLAMNRGGPIWPTESVGLDIDVHPIESRTVVRAYKVADMPRSPTGRRRDLHNAIDCIADAMQGHTFSNDNQVAVVHIKRFVRGELC